MFFRAVVEKGVDPGEFLNQNDFSVFEKHDEE